MGSADVVVFVSLARLLEIGETRMSSRSVFVLPPPSNSINVHHLLDQFAIDSSGLTVHACSARLLRG